jgi:hypothetical protein
VKVVGESSSRNKSNMGRAREEREAGFVRRKTVFVLDKESPPTKNPPLHNTSLHTSLLL